MRLSLPAILQLLFSGLLLAMDAGTFPLSRPGETGRAAEQRGLNEIDALPTVAKTCPVCGYEVAVPEVDTLMRRPGGLKAEERPVWRMHAASIDADLCPYPGPGKVAFQADMAVCPNCGYTTEGKSFSAPVDGETIEWVMTALRQNLRQIQLTLLGRRGDEMSESEVVDFFNSQEEIPDTLRTEHARIYALARHASPLERAEASWLVAFAVRREIVGAPRGEFLNRRFANVREALDKTKREVPGVTGDILAVNGLLGKNRSGKDRLNPSDRLAARLLLAGLEVRQGLGPQAEKTLESLYDDCRERFLKPEQDPLWSGTNARASKGYRITELETIRSEAELEVQTRMELLQREHELLLDAVDCIREAILARQAGDAENALFHAYLAGEFLRRTGNLPLASEWFKTVLALAQEDSGVFQAAERQLAGVRSQAGGDANLLSALGQDGDVFEKLREICK